MALLEQRGDAAAVVEDRFTRLEDEQALPGSGGALVSLARFESERESLLARDALLGVWLKSDESPRLIAEDLESLALVALEFPIFSDGRAYSSARLLRERYGFKGELRAIGDVLCEQLPLMLRSGFNSFEMASEKALEEFQTVVGEVSVVYQPTGDGQATAIDARLQRSR
jgi:uncharacterized protein (DUF934 family)